MPATVNARQVPGRLRRVLGIVIASLLVVLAAVAISSLQATRERPAPGEVLDQFLSAGRADDVDAAMAVLESDATISESGGSISRGSDAARGFIAKYGGYEAGPRQVTGNQVVWTESLPIRA